MSREFSALLTNAVIVCQLVHIISIWDTNGNRMNFIWNVLNWKRDLVIQKFDFTCLVKHTLKREATSWKLNEHVIYNGTQFSPYSSLSRRASALEMVHRVADSTSVIKALGFFSEFPRSSLSHYQMKKSSEQNPFSSSSKCLYDINLICACYLKVIMNRLFNLPSGWLSTITSDHWTTNSVP